MVSTTNWKNLNAEMSKDSFNDVKPNMKHTTDGNLVACSPEFLAVNWSTSGGGAIGIFQSQSFMRVSGDFPLIRGHKALVTDLKFSPFDSSLLASSSEDGTVKLWSIPEGGITEDVTSELQVFNGHSKKANLVEFNNCVKEVIASASSANDIQVWNIIDSSSIASFKLEDNAFSLNWNLQGNLLGAMLKNKKANIFDVRSPDAPVLVCSGHASAKTQKFHFADEFYAFSSGYSSSSNRELNIYDIRAFDKPLSQQKMDNYSGIQTQYYDEDLGLAYFYGKGESIISTWEIKGGNAKIASAPSIGENAISTCFFPKRTMDYNTCELARCARLSKDKIFYVSFKYPRRIAGYAEEFYPDVVCGVPAMSFNEWKSGENKPLNRKKITEIDNKFKSEPMTFDKKVYEEKKPEVVTNEDLIKENESLQNENEELKSRVTMLEETIAKLEMSLKEKENA